MQNKYPLLKQINNDAFKSLNISNKLVIAGPCAVENYESLLNEAKFLLENNISYLRAGAYKPRTSVHDFQGLGYEGIEILRKVKNETGIKIVTEIPDASHIDEFDFVDIIQVGARNMQNFSLLKALGSTNKPIILKRGFGNTIDEWLCAAEYIVSEGNPNVILCERGIKTFETATRNTLDISSIAIIKEFLNIPVIADPSHSAGRTDIILPLSKASLAAGADGLIIEVHPDPSKSYSDSFQALDYDSFKNLLSQLKL